MVEGLDEKLVEIFGYSEFRPLQKEIIESILTKNNTIGDLPTGSGKSLCYQLPSLFLKGMTFVISPLIALMRDQETKLIKLGFRVKSLHSELTPKWMAIAIEEILDNKYDIIYLAPEKFFSKDFKDIFKNLNISHIVFDEAHCISKWGPDFRPKYKKVALEVQKIASKPVLSAFTATANNEVLKDIKVLLGGEWKVFKSSFDRPNIYLESRYEENKIKFLENFFKDHRNEFSLIYCLTKKDVAKVYKHLSELGINVRSYHSGLRKAEKLEIESDFFDGNIDVLVATNAFGMGLDKADIRNILHFQMPGSIESYYQELGRCGRDGKPARGIILYSFCDIGINISLNSNRVYTRGRYAQKNAWVRIMTKYLLGDTCHRRYILSYFGEDREEKCDSCSICLTDKNVTNEYLEVQKILSGLLRMESIYSSKTLIDVLRGKITQTVKKYRLDELSVFNISTKSQKDLEKIMFHLYGSGLIEVVTFKRGSFKLEGVKILPLGIEFIKDKKREYLIRK